MAATSQNRKSSFCKQSTHVQHEREFGLPNEGEFRKFLFLRGDLGGGGGGNFIGEVQTPMN